MKLDDFFSCDTDAYQEEIVSLRRKLHRNNYPERITSAPRNLDRRIEDNTRKLTTLCLPYVKGLAERIQKICSPYDIRTVFTSDSTLPGQQNSTWSRTVFTPSLAVVVKYTKARWRTSEGSSRGWDWKVGYGGPYMEGKGKPYGTKLK